MWLRGDPYVADAMGDCLYEGEPLLPADIAYTPLCHFVGATGDDSTFIVDPPPGRASDGFYALMAPLEDGVWSYGSYYVAAASTQAAGAMTVWLGFR